MSNLIPSAGDSGKKWYQRPENLTGAVFVAFLAIIGYNYGAGLLSGILNLWGFLGLAIAMTIFLALIITQWRLIGTVWQVLMYKLTNAVYKIDPIAIAWAKLDKMREKRDRINDAVVKIKGARNKVVAQVRANETKFNDNNVKIQALHNSKGSPLQLKLLASENVRLEEWNKDLNPLNDTMTNMQEGLIKLFEAANFVIEDKNNDLSMLEQRYNSVKIGWAAIKEAQGIYGTNSKDRADLEQLINIADTDMNNKLAEMDRFMELAAPVFTEVDMEKAVSDIKVQEMIDKVSKGAIDDMIDNITNQNTVPTQKKVTAGKPLVEVPKKNGEPVVLSASKSSESSNQSASKYDLD